MTAVFGSLRDLIYLDFDKAASILSQFEEGLPERTSVTEDSAKTGKAGGTLGVPGLGEASLGGDVSSKHSILYSRTLHHNVLNHIEKSLTDAGLVTDLVASVNLNESSPEAIRAGIGPRPYLRAEGPSVLEDYRRILAISDHFNEMVGFIVKANQEGVKKSAAYLELQALVNELKKEVGKIPDRNKRALQTNELAETQRKIDTLLKPQLEKVEPWLLDGIRLWINTFLSSRLNLRIYPFRACPSFQVLCNLKRECFVDADLDHLLYGYGHQPSVPLAMFGVITALPGATASDFDPLEEFSVGAPVEGHMAFEKAFRRMFGAIDGLEAFVRFSRYPNVTVHPIAVYRSFPVRGAE